MPDDPSEAELILGELEQLIADGLVEVDPVAEDTLRFSLTALGRDARVTTEEP